MKKGDLVKRVRFGIENVPGKRAEKALAESRQWWSDPAVVVRGPYEAVRPETTSGGQQYSKVYRAIDVFYHGQLMSSLPADDFNRI
jgi:hypothetical protein